MKIWCDGSGFNGQASKFGILAEDGVYSSMIFHGRNLTDNQMEYSAIIMACIVASEGDLILSDSQLAVKQINGVWKVKESSLFPLRQAASALIQGKHLSLLWIPPENKIKRIK
jgi:ribonuclease HI